MDILKIFNQLKKYPFGKSLFSMVVARRAPYFTTIHPKVIDLRKGGCIAEMKERRNIQNHIKTVHAIAMCNLCELTMGLATMANIPKNLQWIPKGMTVEYKKIAKGTLQAVVNLTEADFKLGDTPIQIDVFDDKKVNVMSAVITLYVKNKS